MWKLLYQLASPQYFYQISGRGLSWLASGAFLFLMTGFVWGLFYAPPDYQQGDAFRLIYVHVPTAFLSMAIFAFMGFLAFLLLIWRIKLAGVLLRSSLSVGACMALLALVTGSIWGKPMWGAWWVWDARLTSELILLFLYAALLATGQAYQQEEQGDRVVAILTLVGLVDLPIIHYSVYWWNTLHQGATISLLSAPKIHPSMLAPLLVTLFGFVFFSMMLVLYQARTSLLWRERRQRWVNRILVGAPK